MNFVLCVSFKVLCEQRNQPHIYLISMGRTRKTTKMNSPLTLLLCTVDLLTIAVASSSTKAYPSGYGDSESDSCGASQYDLVPQRKEVYGNGRIIDITHRYREDMPSWFSEDGLGLGQFVWLRESMKNGSFANISEMKMVIHTGTHVDAPGHFYEHYFDAGFDVDTLDLDVLNGPALLVDVPRDSNITAEVMKSLNIPRGVRRVLFRTSNTDRGLMWKKEYDTSYDGFLKDGAEWLVENTDIKMIGIDYLSVATHEELAPVHRVFLESREIILVEGLKLDDINVGIYTVHCLPLRLAGAEGSPIRCILIK